MKPLKLFHRSRNGCSACRQSHAKCDEQRPVCNRCYIKNKACDYCTNLVWPDESLVKGVSHGRGTMQCSKSSAVDTSSRHDFELSTQAKFYGAHFLNTTSVDMEQHGYPTQQSRNEFVAKMESPLLLQHRSLTPLPGCDERLISFYDRILCGAATVENSTTGNPFRALLIPLALESPAVLHALQAVAAKSITLHQPVYRRAAVLHYTNALSGLVDTIGNLAKTGAYHFEACVISMLLCWFEICCDTNGRWVSHLTGLLHLLGRRTDGAVIPPFIVNYFLYHFVITRTVRNVENMEQAVAGYVSQAACRTSPSRTTYPVQTRNFSDHSFRAENVETFLSSEDASGITKTLLRWMEPVDLHEINTYPGLSGGLLLLINEVTDLEYLSNTCAIPEHNRKTAGIKAILESYAQHPSDGLHQTTTLQVCSSAETYRCACLLYLHQKVTSIRSRIVVRTTTAWEPLFSKPQISYLVHLILAQLEDKLSLARTMANPLWPLFIAACSTEEDELRVRILALFSRVENDQRFWNVPQVRMLIVNIWRSRDLCADEPIQPLRKYKRFSDSEGAVEFEGGICCDWDRVLQMMAHFTWSLT